ncbi:hypothetical protein Tco_0146642, partial [Tanacetum coccineum]
RHHDSSVTDLFPIFGEFSESDAEKLREVVITLYKPSPSLLYAAGLSHSWKHAGHVSLLKGPDGKVLDEKETKHKKTETKAATKADAQEKAEEAAGKKRAGKEGTSQKKKRKTRQGTPPSL